MYAPYGRHDTNPFVVGTAHSEFPVIRLANRTAVAKMETAFGCRNSDFSPHRQLAVRGSALIVGMMGVWSMGTDRFREAMRIRKPPEGGPVGFSRSSHAADFRFRRQPKPTRQAAVVAKRMMLEGSGVGVTSKFGPKIPGSSTLEK